MADAYFAAIQATSEQHDGDSGVLLGFVMAHELGDLLLGPGHTPDGVMQAAWSKSKWTPCANDGCGSPKMALHTYGAHLRCALRVTLVANSRVVSVEAEKPG